MSDRIISQAEIDIWDCMRKEAERELLAEPMLSSYLHATILSHAAFDEALGYHLSNLLGSETVSSLTLNEIIKEIYLAAPELIKAAALDVLAIRERDSATSECGTPFLHYKGFHALQTYRVAHELWKSNRRELALYLQSRASSCFSVDIHPAAKIGVGIMFDHATGIVIGETAVVGNNVSIMQSVTLGGTGKVEGDRHPKIGNGVLIAAGSKILGNIHIGEGAQVAAGSVVLSDVDAHTTVAGVPAKAIGQPSQDMPALSMDHTLNSAD